VCVCVCVREREGEREIVCEREREGRERLCVCVYVYVCVMCMCMCVCVWFFFVITHVCNLRDHRDVCEEERPNTLSRSPRGSEGGLSQREELGLSVDLEPFWVLLLLPLLASSCLRLRKWGGIYLPVRFGLGLDAGVVVAVCVCVFCECVCVCERANNSCATHVSCLSLSLYPSQQQKQL